MFKRKGEQNGSEGESEATEFELIDGRFVPKGQIGRKDKAEIERLNEAAGEESYYSNRALHGTEFQAEAPDSVEGPGVPGNLNNMKLEGHKEVKPGRGFGRAIRN
jgi:hypothetical protein